ncbi:unnamed protein product [Tilletia controversa]|nr:unnamed protein product [Tilletia controversa]
MVILDTSLLDDIEADSAGAAGAVTSMGSAITTPHALTTARLVSSDSSGSSSSSGSGSGSGSGSSSNSPRSSTSIHSRRRTHIHTHSTSRPIDLISASSTSSAIGPTSFSTAASEAATTAIFSSTPSAVFSASSSLSSMSTPQHYKNVKPLQDAFESTGLASKRLRSALGNANRPRASAPGALPLSSMTPHKAMPNTPVKAKASRSQSFISLRQPPPPPNVGGHHIFGSHAFGGNEGLAGSGSAFSRRHARGSTESSSFMRRAVSAGVVSTPPGTYEAMFNDNDENSEESEGDNDNYDYDDGDGGNGDNDVGRFARRFIVISVLGSGEFSEAVEVEERGGRARYAIKRTKRPATGSKARLRRLEEVDILRELSRIRPSASHPQQIHTHTAPAPAPAPAPQPHPNIVTLLDAWEEEGHLFMQLELCPLGNLADFFEEHGTTSGPLDEPRLWKVLAELAHGLAYIHANGILHLDLKPANVFITSFGSLKIGDFGLASRWPRLGAAEIVDGAGLVLGPDDELDRCALVLAEEVSSPNLDDLDLPRFGPLGEEREKRQAAQAAAAAAARVPNTIPRAFRRLMLEREGDREYLAPEIMSRGQYGRPADMYSLGILMLEAAANVELPDNGDAYQKLRNDDFSDVDISHLSDQLVDILTGPRGLLRSNPTSRPSAEALESNPIILKVRQWMSKGLTLEEEGRFVMAVASRTGPSPQQVRNAQSRPALREFNQFVPQSNDSPDDPFQAPLSLRRDDDVFGGMDEMEEPPRTATRASFFSDPTALTTPVNGYKVLFPAPPPTPSSGPPSTSSFPSTDLSPIADHQLTPSAGGRLPAAVEALIERERALVGGWRGAVVVEEYDGMMGAVLGPVMSVLGDRGVDDVEMSF